MPSKLKHELDKVRGKVSATNRVYEDSIAAIKDALTEAELAIEALESNEINYSTEINSVRGIAQHALSSANSSIKKSGDTIEHLAINGILVIGGATTHHGNVDLNTYQITNPGNIDGRDVSTDGAKLDLIEAAADVTDQTNVTAGIKAICIDTAHRVVYTDSVPNVVSRTVDQNTFFGRATGNIEDLPASAARGILNVADGADVTGSNAPQAHESSHDIGGSDLIPGLTHHMWAWVNYGDAHASEQTLGTLPAHAYVTKIFFHIITLFNDSNCGIYLGTGTAVDIDAYMTAYTLTDIAAGVKTNWTWGVDRGYKAAAAGAVKTSFLKMGGDGNQGQLVIGIEYMILGASP